MFQSWSHGAYQALISRRKCIFLTFGRKSNSFLVGIYVIHGYFLLWFSWWWQWRYFSCKILQNPFCNIIIEQISWRFIGLLKNVFSSLIQCRVVVFYICSAVRSLSRFGITRFVGSLLPTLLDFKVPIKQKVHEFSFLNDNILIVNYQRLILILKECSITFMYIWVL